MSKGFLYGFGPYLHFEDNITSKLIRSLPKTSLYLTEIFEVKFDERMFLKALEKSNPDFVLGMGQHRRARKIRIERCARNRMRHFPEKKTTVITRGAEEKFFPPWKLPVEEGTTVTYHAGTYVCNFSMWIVGKWCEERGVPYGFLHLPINLELSEGRRYLKKALLTLPSPR